MATTYELGEIVAERRLDAVSDRGERTPVVVRIGRPLPDPHSLPEGNGGDWCCPHQILGLGDDTVQASFGVDSLQALLLSVYALQLKLTERANAASVRLDWLGLPDLGLKVDPQVHRLMPTGGSGPDA
ncbi:hypothetical protein NI17_006050 [Thermobifida halotolerans]|uniref:DUF6968 domain-containing protein n=1 Tax=Thermobifida halotolerans TaxID=483545 RepID=A0AA97M4V8_9ACTN|nr:hypothetical protein [Thermobifida halotolerans]UOE20759.1 hypothetical protein NI17_006050 [Thermobifida halotolerans]